VRGLFRWLLIALVVGTPVFPADADPGTPAAGLYDDADTDATPLPPVDPGPATTVDRPRPTSPVARLEPSAAAESPASVGPHAPRVPRAPPAR
jgi:hypothetical protein